MNKIEQVTGPGLPLVLDDIDTDRIIPARFLRCVTFEGIGEHAFEDDRQQDPSHPFNDARYRQAKILVSGRNFGCGSSREHAPQSLMRWGIQAVVAESFAEIFFGNCVALGVPPVCASREGLEKLAAAIAADPQLPVTVDLNALEVRFGNEKLPVTIPASARDAFVTGQWDFLGQLLENRPAIQQRMEKLPYLNEFASA
ncbi:3-isopropylmalate dehydratase small subunit [Planctomicrobium sp. SH661]|uniref:3-isopropylmalate dehydratase small subunit n=1 Tax=Planctomicrobium sp. SH661 TaxID=3448124 RepID=UPI003F5C4BDC